MCAEAVRKDPYTLKFFTDHYKISEKCERAIEEEPCTLNFFVGHLKTQEMCFETVPKGPLSSRFVPNCYVRLQEMWYKDCLHVVAPEPWSFVECRSGFKKRKALKSR